MSDSNNTTDLYGDGELPGDADLNAPEASTDTDAESTASDVNADTNTEGNVDPDADSELDSGLENELPDGPGSAGGGPSAGVPLP